MEEMKRDSDDVAYFDTVIPLSSKIPESDLARQSIFKYAKGSLSASSFAELVDEFLQKTGD